MVYVIIHKRGEVEKESTEIKILHMRNHSTNKGGQGPLEFFFFENQGPLEFKQYFLVK